LGGTGQTSAGSSGQALVSNGTNYAPANVVNTLTAGSGISITGSSGNYTIAQSGTGTVLSVTGSNIGVSPTTGNVVVTLSGSNVTSALGYTPVNPTTLSGYASLSGSNTFTSTLGNTFTNGILCGATGAGVGVGTNDINFSQYTSIFYSSSELQFSVSTSGVNPVLILGNTAVYSVKQLVPNSDNSVACGGAANRWTQIYAVSNTINTSDATEKTEINALSDAEKRVATRIKSLIKTYKWNDSVAKKGSNGARIHVGLLAQDVGDAFTAEGLDPHRYGMFCFDEWEAADEVLGQDGSVVRAAVEAGSRYGVRYEELLAFVIAVL
jgi:hypothetical protein